MLASKSVTPSARHVVMGTSRPQLPVQVTFASHWHQQKHRAISLPRWSPLIGDMNSDGGLPEPQDGSSPASSPVKAKRRVVDIEPADEDLDQDEEVLRLQGLGTTTHHSRNLHLPVIPVRKRRRIVPGVNVRATTRKWRDAGVSKAQSFMADLNIWEVEREERAQVLSKRHGMKIKEVRRRMCSGSTFKAKRAVTLYNAKISALMKDLNEGLGVGERHRITDVKRMVRDDPSMLDDFTEEEEAEMLADLLEKRKLKRTGARANNIAAVADAKRAMDRLLEEMTGLAERTGMLGFAMFTRGHLHDTTVPVTIQSWGALDFFREILKRDPADVAALLELWAVSRDRGTTGADTLLSMQKEGTFIITSGLQAIVRKMNAKMNYENYIKGVVEKYNVGLVGWPDGVDFKRMSMQSSIVNMRKLRNALKDGSCRWKVLTATQKAQLIEKFEDMVESGEVAQKERKKSGKKAASKEPRERRSSSRKTKVKKGPKVRKGRHGREEIEEDDEGDDADEDGGGDNEDDDEGEEGTKREQQRRRLLALVKQAQTKDTNSKAGKKRKRAEDDSGEDEREEVEGKKAKRDERVKVAKGKARGERRAGSSRKDKKEKVLVKKTSVASSTGRKKRKAPEDNEDEEDEEEDAPAPKKPRPKPRPLTRAPAPAPSTTKRKAPEDNEDEEDEEEDVPAPKKPRPKPRPLRVPLLQPLRQHQLERLEEQRQRPPQP
ncbi:hypothetical protein B0H15DRAFT_956759 [Mycena belliarum]|uniref:Uncharacterized protein n=1 Tax=Mycena belliarum TaxID=1033014 RepID=A0AAD6XJ67_9AGAR|nr:hypothetical protein B0H15DRAFT_956759 [Mycena belliae]